MPYALLGGRGGGPAAPLVEHGLGDRARVERTGIARPEHHRDGFASSTAQLIGTSTTMPADARRRGSFAPRAPVR
jgi:hypothetical protein